MAGKPNSARQENRKPSKRAKPRFSQYRAGAYKADPAFPLFPSWSWDPRRKTELLICRTSRPAPRKTPHPLKEGIGYKLTAGRRRSESLILDLLLLLFQIGTQLSPGGQWSEPAAPTFEFGNWKIKLVGVKTLHWTMTSIEPINTGKDSTWIFQILRSSYQSGCESRKHSNANLWEIRLR